MGENFECFIDTLAMCNISEFPNAVDEISTVNNSNTTSVESADVLAFTLSLVFILLRMIGDVGLIFAIFIIGFKHGSRWGLSDAVDWLNKYIFNPIGSTLSIRNGRPVVQATVAGGANQPIVAGGAQGQGPMPVIIKKKKMFIPPMWNPPSRTPDIPRN